MSNNTLQYNPKLGAYFPPFEQYFGEGSNIVGKSCYIQISHDQYKYCTLESSSPSQSPMSVNDVILSSPMSQKEESESYYYPATEPRLCPSPESNSNMDAANELRLKLKELETVMLGPDLDILATSCNNDRYNLLPDIEENWRQMMEAIPRGDLNKLLVACAKAMSNNDLFMAQWLISELRQLVSVFGEPIQRLGAYMLEGLVARMDSSGSSIYKSLRCSKEPIQRFELLSYMHILHEACPYFKFGYMSANGAIAEAMKDENRVHILDFQIGQGTQWITLIQAFAARPGGPPQIRITGIDDSVSAYARGGGLTIVGRKLSKLAHTFKVPFQFHSASMSQLQNLGIRPGEALAVNFAFMLHHIPDESVSTQNHRDMLLRSVKSLNPKVVTLVEQESNTNTAAFFPRFLEALDYYTAMFESIDATLPRERKERINVEQHCLARDVVNIIACEGTERVERHELLGKWKLRFKMAGFSPYPLSSLVNLTIKTLLQNYCTKYRLQERDGALYLGWLNRDLVASCAWK